MTNDLILLLLRSAGKCLILGASLDFAACYFALQCIVGSVSGGVREGIEVRSAFALP